MKQLETKNYIFNFKENSLVEKDIDKIASLQESCFEYICNVLNKKPDFKIEYFLCETAKEVGEVYGDNEACNGFCDLPNKIYAVYNNDVKCIGFHEDAHIVSYLINIPQSVFVREGIAMYFDKVWWGINNDHIVSYLISKNYYIDIYKLLNDDEFYKYDCSITYSIAGSFTSWLISSFGINKYLDFYKQKSTISEAFKNIYSLDIKELSIKYYDYINLFNMDNSLIKLIDEIYKRKGA